MISWTFIEKSYNILDAIDNKATFNQRISSNYIIKHKSNAKIISCVTRTRGKIPAVQPSEHFIVHAVYLETKTNSVDRRKHHCNSISEKLILPKIRIFSRICGDQTPFIAKYSSQITHILHCFRK